MPSNPYLAAWRSLPGRSWTQARPSDKEAIADRFGMLTNGLIKKPSFYLLWEGIVCSSWFCLSRRSERMSIELHLSHEYGSSKRCTFNTSINGLHSLYNWAIQPKKKNVKIWCLIFLETNRRRCHLFLRLIPPRIRKSSRNRATTPVQGGSPLQAMEVTFPRLPPA